VQEINDGINNNNNNNNNNRLYSRYDSTASRQMTMAAQAQGPMKAAVEHSLNINFL
jgi:hypothetical protein